MEINDYIKLHKSRFVEESFQSNSYSSMNAHAHRQPEIKQCAERWKELEGSRVDEVQIFAYKWQSCCFAKDP